MYLYSIDAALLAQVCCIRKLANHQFNVRVSHHARIVKATRIKDPADAELSFATKQLPIGKISRVCKLYAHSTTRIVYCRGQS